MFTEALNGGKLAALVALYEPNANLMPEPGRVVVGTEAIREALSGFLAAKPTITMTNKVLAQTNDITLMTCK